RIAGVDFVVVGKTKSAVGADMVGREIGRHRLDAVALAHQHGLDVGGDHHAAAWIEREGTRVNAVSVGVLDPRRLAAYGIDGKHRDVVLAAGKNLLALEIDRVAGAVADIDGAAVGVDMHGAGGLP